MNINGLSRKNLTTTIMQRLQLEVTEQRIKHEDGMTRFSLRGNGILLEISVPRHEARRDLAKVNEGFANHLRYIKFMGGYPDKDHRDEKIMMHELKSNWSQTNTGIAIRPISDGLKEFERFVM